MKTCQVGKELLMLNFRKERHGRESLFSYDEKIMEAQEKPLPTVKSRAIKIAKGGELTHERCQIFLCYALIIDTLGKMTLNRKSSTAYIGYVDKDDDWAFTAEAGSYHLSPLANGQKM